MGIQYEGQIIPTCFATSSISHKLDDTLPNKLQAIYDAGFDAVEMSMPDILAYGNELYKKELNDDDYDAIVDVAKDIRRLTEELGLRILLLQPFTRFEGWDSETRNSLRKDVFARAKQWMRIMEALGTDMLQIGSSDAPAKDMTSSWDEMAKDLAALADIMAPKGFRIAYENWCWATHASTWNAIWEIVQRSKRSNIGLCLDTFQSAGGEYGDPTTDSGLIGGMGKAHLDMLWRRSMKELEEVLPSERIFLLQISDAYKMDPPLDPIKEKKRPRSKWSQAERPLPFDGGYLPVQEFLDAVLRTGFRGWLSMEVFDSGTRQDISLKEYTTLAMESLKRLLLYSAPADYPH